MAVPAIVAGIRAMLPQLNKGAGKVVKDAFFGGGAFKGGVAQTINKRPVLAGLSALGAVGLGTEVLPPLYRGVQQDFSGLDTRQVMNELNAAEDRDAILSASMARKQNVERELARQSARLAAANPHLYNQIIAGRRLPQGAVILGGSPRTDLMEQIASGMASNPQLQQPGPAMAPQDQFLNELGV